MLQTFVSSAGRFLGDLSRVWLRERNPVFQGRSKPVAPAVQQPLRRLTLTDEVSRTLFEEYAAHRSGHRGEDETGWILLGLREVDEAVVLATLPAGTQCSAGVAHVKFNSSAQALASRIVRQTDRRIRMLGVVHTHPGSLRHPSDGDYRGDSEWVKRFGAHVFGIGTADGRVRDRGVFARQPRPNVQSLGDLTFSWYGLGQGDPDYWPLSYRLTLGPDLARPLHSLWSVIENHAERLDRLCRQQVGVTFAVSAGKGGPALAVTIPLTEPYHSVRVLLEGKEVRYYLLRDDEVAEVDLGETRVDCGVYLLLAELAARC